MSIGPEENPFRQSSAFKYPWQVHSSLIQKILNQLYEKCVAGSRDLSIVYFWWRITKFCFTWKVNIDFVLRCPESSALSVQTNISCLFVEIHLSLGIPDKIVWVAAGGGATISGIPASLSLLRFPLLFVLSQRQNKALPNLFALINKRKGCNVVSRTPLCLYPYRRFTFTGIKLKVSCT